MHNTKKLKIMTIFGTRPEIIRLSRILPKMDEYFNHVTVFTRQSYDFEMSEVFFKDLELRKPDYNLNVKSETLGGQIANIFEQTEKVLQKENPDALLVLGDTNSSLAAILAKRFKILVFHMEAGNRSFDWNVPEEINRRIIDHISDYNLAYTEHARRYLLQEGINPATIIVTGSPLAEVFNHFEGKIEKSAILEKMKLKKKRYFVVSVHREENVDNKKNLKELFESFSSIAKEYRMPVVVSVHPRTRKRMQQQNIKSNSQIILSKPLGHLDYNKLQKYALCVLSDSGSIQEESAILKFKAIQIRVSTERPEAFDAGSIILAGFNKDSIMSAINLSVSQEEQEVEGSIPNDYRDIHVSSKVVKLIMGLTGNKKYHNRKYGVQN